MSRGMRIKNKLNKLLKATFTLSYGHTMLKAPDPVRSPQLSNIWTSQYYGGGPHGNTGCCSSFIFFFFFSWYCKCKFSAFIIFTYSHIVIVYYYILFLYFIYLTFFFFFYKIPNNIIYILFEIFDIAKLCRLSS